MSAMLPSLSTPNYIDAPSLGVVLLMQTHAHSDAPSCRHTHTPMQSSHCTLRRTLMQAHTHPSATIYAPPVHTHTQTPLHNLTHTAVTPTHAHPCSNIRTICAHPYTYLQISTNIKPTIVTMPIYKYLQISTLSHYSTYHLNVYSFSLL